jgi:hypothetical protein
MGPSSKVLADGRNSHLIQKDKNWWRTQLRQYFEIPDNGVIEKSPLLFVVCGPRKINAKKKKPTGELIHAR